MPQPELTYELWSHIASYLPRREVPKLLGLNRALCAVALDERYRVLCIGLDPSQFPKLHPRGDEVYHKLRKSPSLCKRVREIEFKIHQGACLTIPSIKIRPWATQRRGGRPREALEVVALQDLLRLMPFLTKIALRCENGPKPDSPTFHLIRLCLTRFLPSPCSTKSLDLELPIWSSDVLTNIPQTPHLHSFNLVLQIKSYASSASHPTDYQRAKTHVVGFMNARARTLVDWGMTFDWAEHDMSPLFEPLNPMPNLRSLTLYLGHFTDISPLIRYTNAHPAVQSLRILLLQRVGPDGAPGSSHPFLTIGSHDPSAKPMFSDLRSLTIELRVLFPRPEALDPSILNFVRIHSPMLVSLSIINIVLRLDSIVGLLQIIPRDGPLRSLALDVAGMVMEIKLFDLVSVCIPKLLELHLVLNSFPIFDEILDALDSSDYYQWSLRYLSLNYSRVGSAPAFGDRYTMSLKGAIPTLAEVDLRL